ncbi:MAG: hypothetical protein ACK2T0_02625, partial [Anaerolineales bacterium]
LYDRRTKTHIGHIMRRHLPRYLCDLEVWPAVVEGLARLRDEHHVQCAEEWAWLEGWAARPPNAKELKATSVVRIQIEEASAKIRSGPVGDDEEDYALPVWAGVIPLRDTALPPLPDDRLPQGIAAPAYVKDYSRRPH